MKPVSHDGYTVIWFVTECKHLDRRFENAAPITVDRQNTVMKRDAVTIKDVADRAGVSRATVSRVLTGSARVSPEKEKSVRDAIAVTGFQASVSAQRLATGRSESIAVILTEPVDELLVDPTYATVLRGILDAMTPTIYSPILLMASVPREIRKTTRLLQRGAADAVIHLSPYTQDVLIDEVLGASIPLVLCGLPSTGRRISGFSAVYSDDVEGGRKIAGYLYDKGCRRLAAIMGPIENPATSDRMQGIESVFAGASLVGVRYSDWSAEGGYRACRQLLEAGVVFDSLACGNDRLAVGAIDALHEANIVVPQDIRVSGFDDHPLAENSGIQLTTLRLPFRKQGAEAVCIAEDMINGSRPRIEVLGTELVVRDSA